MEENDERVVNKETTSVINHVSVRVNWFRVFKKAQSNDPSFLFLRLGIYNGPNFRCSRVV